MTESGPAARLAGLARRPWTWAVLGVLVAGLCVASLRYAPWFTVDEVTVRGNTQVSASEVIEAAQVTEGAPLLMVPVEDVADRVEQLDAVATVEVSRHWPNQVQILVEERRAVGYVAVGAEVGLVGSDRRVYRVESRAPSDLPELMGVTGALGEPLTVVDDASTVLAVAESLPRWLLRATARIEAGGPRRVDLAMDDGMVVRWGSPADAEQKAEVLSALRESRQWGRAFTRVDVSAPDAPALSG